jgi:hypothetical protein
LNRHQNIESRLDALREQVVAGLSASPAESSSPPGVFPIENDGGGWREFILLVRWHLAGLAAMWVLITVFRFAGDAAEPSRMTQGKRASPGMIIASLKDNRRQLSEFGGAPVASGPWWLPQPPRSRRSQVQIDSAYT